MSGGLFWGSAASPRPIDWACLFLHEHWFETYGHTLRIWGLMARPMIFTLDPVAIRHILSSPAYEKGEAIRHQLGELVGQGLLFVEGADHKKQRRVMNPAFGPLQVRRFTETFVSKTNEMRDLWMDLCSRNTTRSDGFLRIDGFAWLNKVTLDIIGLAGFDYNIDSLHASEDAPNALNEAVRTLFSFSITLSVVLQIFIPPLRKLPTKRVRETAKAKAEITEIGMRLIAEKKAAILSEVSSGASLEKKDIQGNDLLSLLIRANLASDLPESARLSDRDILAQVPTFLVAGKLRDELLAVPTGSPTEAELDHLPYLDAVVRETLRLHSPVYGSEREAAQDDVVPLKTPYTGTDGVAHHEIHVSKGDLIAIPITTMNRSVAFWGEDAHEFRPERWFDLPESVKELPGAWSNQMTFLGGVHACIGYRFSVAEMKALMFVIARSFEFKLAVSPVDIMRKSMIVGRPALSSNPAAGAQLPLLIRPVGN
ncbi:cytochrome P450 [Peniophora sp. CONT]|nr:cytochrome P450 [Peniophora sp. CONT]